MLENNRQIYYLLTGVSSSKFKRLLKFFDWVADSDGGKFGRPACWIFLKSQKGRIQMRKLYEAIIT